MTMDEIVTGYISNHRPDALKEMRFFAIQRRLEDAIRHAALCHLPSGKRHPHQRRIPKKVLTKAERRLQSIRQMLSGARDFADLHGMVKSSIGPVHGIGKLAVYDISHRIGTFLCKPPQLVYLHAGTAVGAATLEIRGETIHPNALPAAFARLAASEIEDCLCIYKDELRGVDR